MLVIDIETISLPDAPIPEFSAPANLKDPEKIRAAIEQKRADWLADGALHAERGQVVLIGMQGEDNTPTYFGGSGEPESELLKVVWDRVDRLSPVIGFNLHRFDLPFLIRRSWINGVHVPMGSIFQRGRIDENRWIDLLKVWQCGDRQEYISLDMLARTLLGRGKEGTRADFGKLWAEDRQKAIDYCKADVQLTYECAKKMGVI